MRKYYTRACNFYHGKIAKRLIKTKKALPLNGKKTIAFDNIEILKRDKNKIKSQLIHIKNLNKLNSEAKKIIKNDLKKIVNKRKISFKCRLLKTMYYGHIKFNT